MYVCVCVYRWMHVCICTDVDMYAYMCVYVGINGLIQLGGLKDIDR